MNAAWSKSEDIGNLGVNACIEDTGTQRRTRRELTLTSGLVHRPARMGIAGSELRARCRAPFPAERPLPGRPRSLNHPLFARSDEGAPRLIVNTRL